MLLRHSRTGVLTRVPDGEDAHLGPEWELEGEYPTRAKVWRPGAADTIAEDVETLVADPPERPRGNASRDVWAAYAEAVGVTVSDDMGRDDIRDAVKDL